MAQKLHKIKFNMAQTILKVALKTILDIPKFSFKIQIRSCTLKYKNILIYVAKLWFLKMILDLSRNSVKTWIFEITRYI